MFHHELEYRGRLAIFKYEADGQLVVTASGYLIHEENQSRLYLVSLSEVKLTPPRRLVHLALARFAKELGATHLVPVASLASQNKVSLATLNEGLTPCLPAVPLDDLVAKLS
jgi:hypothetical protein